MPARRTFRLTRTTTAPPERVFDLLADGAGWARWAGPLVPVSRWEREGVPAPGGVGAVRVLGRKPLENHEEVTEHVRPRRHAYRITAGVPVHSYRGEVDLEPLDGGGTRITWGATFEPRAAALGAPLLAGSRFVVGSILTRLVREAERPGT